MKLVAVEVGDDPLDFDSVNFRMSGGSGPFESEFGDAVDLPGHTPAGSVEIGECGFVKEIPVGMSGKDKAVAQVKDQFVLIEVRQMEAEADPLVQRRDRGDMVAEFRLADENAGEAALSFPVEVGEPF